jgi:hypothetical protein
MALGSGLRRMAATVKAASDRGGANVSKGPAMADSDDRKTDSLELASAIVLSIAALTSSWASYQSGLWDGEQAANYSTANALRIEASRVALEGDALAGVEVQLFTSWLDAKVHKQDALAKFYEARFPPTLKPAFQRWMQNNPLSNPKAPPTPFARDNYVRPGAATARDLDRKAQQTFQAGQHANAVSDAFEQGATMLAIALFFGGIGQVFKARAPRIGLLTVAGVTLVLGLIRVFTLPAQILGLISP